MTVSELLGKLRRHLLASLLLALGLVAVAGLRGMPQNSVPEFGIPVWIALMVLAAATAINHSRFIRLADMLATACFNMPRVDEQKGTTRREAVYDVEAFLEDEGLALYYTRYKGDEQLPGEQVGLDIIRRVLEREE